MADSKISDLSAATSLAASDLFVIAQEDTANKKVSAAVLPGYEFAYAQITSNASITSTNSAAPDVVVTAGAVVLDGSTVVLVEFYTPGLLSPGGGASRGTFVQLWDAIDGGAAASIGIIAQSFTTANADVRMSSSSVRRFTPIAGSHVFSIRASVTAGTGTITADAGGSVTQMPTFIRVTKA